MASRRETLRRFGELAGLAGLATVWPTGLQADRGSLLPFRHGDVVVGCTLLDDPKDDHRGRGRLLHYDADLSLRQTLWIDDTTHLIQGLRFDRSRTLWAFDAFAHRVLRFSADGRRLADFPAPSRGFSNITFAKDGRVFLGEFFVGTQSRVPLKTTLPFLPGTRRFGDGHLFEFSRDGRLLHEHTTPVQGGMGGFQGLCFSTLSPDDSTLVYVSETGSRVFRWDLIQRRPLPDLVEDRGQGTFFFDLAFDGADRLVLIAGTTLEILEWPSGRSLTRWPLPAFGFATLSPPLEGHTYLCNFFSGEIVRLELASGRITARVETGVRKSASGVVEIPS